MDLVVVYLLASGVLVACIAVGLIALITRYYK